MIVMINKLLTIYIKKQGQKFTAVPGDRKICNSMHEFINFLFFGKKNEKFIITNQAIVNCKKLDQML